MNLKRFCVPLALSVSFIAPFIATSVEAATARLRLSGEPGNYVTRGQDFDITYDTDRGDRIFSSLSRRLPDGSPAFIRFSLDRRSTPENEYSILSFGTDQLGIALQEGFFAEARRASFAPAGFAGLDVSFQNRGSNRVYGSFTILDVVFSRDLSEIISFEATFTQRSESPSFPALTGRFEYDSGLEADIPEPLTLVGSLLAISAGVALKRRQKTEV